MKIGTKKSFIIMDITLSVIQQNRKENVCFYNKHSFFYTFHHINIRKKLFYKKEE